VKNVLVAALAGLVFGLGLILSGMVFPAKVQGFLDLAGAWDPSLALVMVAAITVGLPAFALARRRGVACANPSAQPVERRLITGSLLFGIGWGLAGLCPGPALVVLGLGDPKAAGFVAAMLAGMALYEVLERRSGQG
jgi:uncharacterized protein